VHRAALSIFYKFQYIWLYTICRLALSMEHTQTDRQTDRQTVLLMITTDQR